MRRDKLFGVPYAPAVLETFLEGEEGIFLPGTDLAASQLCLLPSRELAAYPIRCAAPPL